MSVDFVSAILFILFAVVLLGVAASRYILDIRARGDAEGRLNRAEDRAFAGKKDAGAEGTQKGVEGKKEGVEGRKEAVEGAEKGLEMPILYNLYHAQIAKYQLDTQTRASFSFLCALFSMLVGFGMLVWGMSQMIAAGVQHTTVDTHQLISGSAIATIGGATSAFITKTFLDVHKLSLSQLNYYFKQPVLNAHILSAERLVQKLAKGDAQECAYRHLADVVTELITMEQGQSVGPEKEAKKSHKGKNSEGAHGKGSSEEGKSKKDESSEAT